MDAPPKTLCAKCFNSLNSNFIACHICKAKFHFICAKINDKDINLLQENFNIVFNCNDCLSASSEMLSLISSISIELRELKDQEKFKDQVLSSISSDVNVLKQEFNKLSKNLEIASKQNKCNFSELFDRGVVTNNNNARNKSHTDVVVGGSNENNKHTDDDASSLTSIPTVTTDLRSNVFDANNQHDEWTNVRRRRRRNRILAVGENVSNDLAVVVKKKFLHISSFNPSVTTDQILNYVEKNAKIDKQHLECTRLVKKDVDVTSLKHVNFKIGVSPSFYDELIKPTVWPINIKIRPFIFFPRKPVELPNPI